MQTIPTVDIIIPSFRLEEKYLLPLINLPKPQNRVFNYYIVVDNPSVTVPASIQKLAQLGAINLHINEKNLGAAASRNKGIENGKGEWILFLDDDVIADKDILSIYSQAIEEHPDEIGFIGLTDFPLPHNAFTLALQANELTFFKIANSNDYFKWGVTANMMYNRSSIQELRFSHIFPKNGGGEDVDFPLRISHRHNKEFKCVKEAKVTHPWWNNGKPHFDRFMRYGIGIGHLMPLHKNLVWRDFPNTIESMIILIISTPLFVFLWGWSNWIITLLAIPVFEYIIVYLKAKSLGVSSLKASYYIALLKNSFDWGILKTILKENHLYYFMKRINIGSSKTHNYRLNKWKIIKISLFVILFTCLAII